MTFHVGEGNTSCIKALTSVGLALSQAFPPCFDYWAPVQYAILSLAPESVHVLNDIPKTQGKLNNDLHKAELAIKRWLITRALSTQWVPK